MVARCSDRHPCRREIAQLRGQIEIARRKLKFCEWQAEPDEIARVAGQVAKMERELAALTREPPEGVIASPWRGLVASVDLAPGQQVGRGAVALTLADAGRFVVAARSGGESLEGAVPSEVRLARQGSIQSYTARLTATWHGDVLRVEVPAAVGSLSQATCQLELSRRKISLLRAWLR